MHDVDHIPDFDGEAVRFATIKIASAEAYIARPLQDGDRVLLTLEVEVDGKKGVNHPKKDGILVRQHHAKVIRVGEAAADIAERLIADIEAAQDDRDGTPGLPFEKLDVEDDGELAALADDSEPTTPFDQDAETDETDEIEVPDDASYFFDAETGEVLDNDPSAEPDESE